MKTTQVIVILLIGIILGYIIRMIVHKHDYAFVDPPKQTPVKIDAGLAKQIVNDYKGKSKYFYLNDELLSQLVWLKSQHNSDGSAVFYADTTPTGDPADTLYDAAVIVRTTGDSTEPDYYQVSADKKGVGDCPYVCDVRSPF